MTWLRKALTEQISIAEEQLSDLMHRADDQLKEKNKCRQRKRIAQGKKSRRSSGKYPNPIFRPVPDRAAAHDAFARQLVCARLLSKIDLLEAGFSEVVVEKLRGEAVPADNARQEEKVGALYLYYLDEWAAKLARNHDRALDQEGLATLDGGVAGLYAALTIRADCTRHALMSLESAQVSDRMAATLYMREAARLAVLERFTTSNHLASPKDFRWKASLIKLDFPSSLARHGELGRSAWIHAFDEFVSEMTEHFGTA